MPIYYHEDGSEEEVHETQIKDFEVAYPKAVKKPKADLNFLKNAPKGYFDPVVESNKSNTVEVFTEEGTKLISKDDGRDVDPQGRTFIKPIRYAVYGDKKQEVVTGRDTQFYLDANESFDPSVDTVTGEDDLDSYDPFDVKNLKINTRESLNFTDQLYQDAIENVEVKKFKSIYGDATPESVIADILQDALWLAPRSTTFTESIFGESSGWKPPTIPEEILANPILLENYKQFGKTGILYQLGTGTSMGGEDFWKDQNSH